VLTPRPDGNAKFPEPNVPAVTAEAATVPPPPHVVVAMTPAEETERQGLPELPNAENVTAPVIVLLPTT